MSGTTDLTARKGVEAVRSLLVELGWYPREPSDPDQGIDLLVETAVDGIADGRMLAMQIKSGTSQVSEQNSAHAVHRCSDRHVKYWLGHSLPVLVVLYDPNEKLAYWQVVSDETVLSTGQGWKIDVPFDQTLAPASEEALRALARDSHQAPVDWAAVLERGPLALLEDGEQRYSEALALRASEPQKAAVRLLELSGELKDHHGDDTGNLEAAVDRLRGEAARSAAEGGDLELACTALLAVVRRCIEQSSQPISFHIETLRGWLAHERWWIANTWRACLEWPEDLQAAIDTLTAGVEAPEDSLVNDKDRNVWRERLIELLLIAGAHETALAQSESLPALAGKSSETLARLHALRAETLGLLDLLEDADAIWERLSEWAGLNGPTDRPALRATLAARRAVALVRRERLESSQEAFAEAALCWGRVVGAEDEVAEQYFSARAAEGLIGDPWSSRRDDWRTVAVALRGREQTPDAIAERLELQGLNARVIGQGFDALNRFSLALVEHRRAGHLRGELYATHLLVELYEHAGEHAAALDGAIQGGRVRDAERLAVSTSAVELRAALQPDGAIWTRQPSLAALAAAGRRLDGAQVVGLAEWILAEARRPIESSRDRDLAFAAHGALAALIFEWPPASAEEALALLKEGLGSGNLLLAEPAATALLLLTNAGRGDYTDALTDAFLDSQHARVPAWWVAGRLHDHKAARERVLAAAGDGRLDALEVGASAEINRPGSKILDVTARQALDGQLRALLERRIGHNAEGHFIGNLRLEPWGLFARVSDDGGLREQVAKKLLAFALDDEEPHASRASAVNAIFNLGGGLGPAAAASFAKQLRPIAEGRFASSRWDEPREVVEHPFNRSSFAENASADRLRAAAVLACAALTAILGTRPQWPAELLAGALFSSEAAVVAGALEAVARFDEIALPPEVSALLVHADAGVRRAALMAWRRRDDVPSRAILDRLVDDTDLGVRLTLLGLLRDGDREPQLRAQMAGGDPDAYVRAMARARLPTAEALTD